ncbi:rad17 cell cycle checkpoint protein [Sarocladium implicatum]|nr:rad17 cell cycle checkpoint protein [Sarocladium implicatum]
MAPPAKRRRRNVVEASDDEDDHHQQNTLSNFLLSSPSSPTKRRISVSSPSPSKNASPTKSPANASNRVARRPQPTKNGSASSPKKGAGLQKQDGFKTADLKTLFSKQAQRSATSIAATNKRNDSIEDLISDDISDDEISEMRASSSSLVSQHAKKRQRDGSQVASSDPPSASQRFLKPPKPVVSEGLDDDLRPWSERFGPRNLDELVVHKKKVADVRRWLEDVMTGRMRQRLLILKGAAGSGKTTTMRLLAADMGCELLEWRNPSGHTGAGFVSTSAQFHDFLGRGGKFGALEMDGPSTASQAPPPSSSSSMSKERQRRIMLVEEFPNTFSRSSSALSSFRKSVLNYLASHTPSLSMFASQHPKESIQPVVMVISETLLTTTSASADSFTAHRLLGPEILRHPGVGVIEFNAIAPSLLAKALELIVQKEARKSGRRKTPGPLVLKRIGEIGDIRSAVSTLEFLCLKGDQDSDWGAKVTFTKPKKTMKNGVGLTRGEEESLELVSQREASLGIFHAVGKVVYNKRDDEAVPSIAEQLPSYLSMFSRPKPSQVSVDALIDETGTDTHTFISALHENYVLSCESTGPMDLSTSMDYVNECIEYLSISDLMCPSRDVFFGGRGGFAGRDSGSHILRQDEITFEVAVRGMLFSLPNPVKRKTTTMAKASDAFKMFYPASLKLWRSKEEIEGLVDHWSTRLLKGTDSLPVKNLTDRAGAFRRPQQSSEISWMQRQQQQQQRQQAPQATDSSEQSETAPPLLSLGSAARRELLLERLPYMAQIARGSKSTGVRLRDLEKVVSFQGIHTGLEEESDGEDAEPVTGEAWATDKPNEEASPRKKSGIKAGGMSGMLAQKLVLSDDDIED